MATQAVADPASLKTWEEAFQYPLPTVRNLSTRLRKNIDEHRSRLRSLVGTSYRDLLGTAERIIEMDRQIQSVEAGLSDLGRRCNSSILERADTNYAALERSWSQNGDQDKKLGALAQSKILTASLAVVKRLIRTGDDPLQAAKLMILTRLLYKSLSESAHASLMLERYRKTIASLRSKLLAYIDRKLGQQQATHDDLSASLAAYAMMTSSSPKDVLKHFLAVRLATLESLMAAADAEGIVKALGLYSSSFTSVQTVFPKRLAELLAALSKVTLLSDRHLKTVDELSLDVYGRWVPDDIRTFTPWVQKDSLTAQEGKEAVKDFTLSARGVVLDGVKQFIEAITSQETVLNTRQTILGAMLRHGTNVKPQDFTAQLEELREVFAARLDALTAHTVSMEEFVIEPSTTSASSTSSLWDFARNELDLSAGGSRLRAAIVRQRDGRDASLDTVIAPYEAWRARVEHCWNGVTAMRAIKWDEHVERDLDDADEEDADIYNEQLSTQDADRLQQTLYRSVMSVTARIFEQIAVSTAAAATSKSQFLIRVLRELQTQHVSMSRRIELPNGPSLLHYDVARSLHEQLAHSIADVGVSTLLESYHSRHYLPLDLWEGTPSLPSQPLPATFQYVLTLQREMVKIGEDVWTPAAVAILKQAVRAKLGDVLAADIVVSAAAHVETQPDTAEHESKTEDNSAHTVHGNDADSIVNEANQEGSVTLDISQAESNATSSSEELELPDLSQDYTQRLFDAIYISKVFQTTDAHAGMQAQVDILQARSKLESKEVRRLHKQVGEYWKKTYLLFGLLAHPSTSFSEKRATEPM